MNEAFIYKPPENASLSIVYEDEGIVAVSKPAGLLSVRGRKAEHQDSMHSRLQEKYPEALVVHRLDMDTSGLMIFARSKDVQRDLNKQFSRRSIKKTYIALVQGIIEQDSGNIDLPIRCDWPNRPKQIVCHKRGKEAFTRFSRQSIDKKSEISRIRLEPLTGRSHQLRIHMASIGYPIVGDRFYGDDGSADRLFLHSESAEIVNPTNRYVLRLVDHCPF